MLSLPRPRCIENNNRLSLAHLDGRFRHRLPEILPRRKMHCGVSSAVAAAMSGAAVIIIGEREIGV